MKSKFGIKNWAKLSFVFGLSSFALLAACTDYVDEIDDQIDELKELQALNTGLFKSSSSSRGNFIVEGSSSSSHIDLASSESLVNSSSEIAIPKSSAGWVIKSSSSSVGRTDPVSSSSAAVVVTGLGSCAPAKATIEKNGSVAWNFTPNLSEGSMQDFLGASYSWNFGSDGDGTGMTSSPVTYGTSGKHLALLTVTMGLKQSVIECSPLLVNGDPISYCECSTSAAEIDYAAQPNAVWTVSGCTSASKITDYVWNDSETGLSFTHTFTAKGETQTPTLKVMNADSTVVDVICPTVTATASGPSTCPNITVKKNGARGSGFASRYWDCCKSACSWSNYANGNYSKQCTDKGKIPNTNWDERSVCDGGYQMTCTSQSPFTIDGCDGIGFAFAAVPEINGGACGKCYQLTFDGKGKNTTDANDEAIEGKKLIVMTTDLGFDQGQFDIKIPGGGTGVFEGCSSMGWGNQGAQYGGLLTDCEKDSGYDPAKTLSCLKDKCNSSFGNDTEAMQGCLFLANFMHAADNPTHNYVEVECPDVLIERY